MLPKILIIGGDRMFTIDGNTIAATRGDFVFFTVTAEENGAPYVFEKDSVLRFKVFERKSCEQVVFQKDILVEIDKEEVEVFLSGEDTKWGEVISKPVDYWYEVELNPETEPQTIIGYTEDGPAVFRLLPEGGE